MSTCPETLYIVARQASGAPMMTRQIVRCQLGDDHPEPHHAGPGDTTGVLIEWSTATIVHGHTDPPKRKPGRPRKTTAPARPEPTLPDPGRGIER